MIGIMWVTALVALAFVSLGRSGEGVRRVQDDGVVRTSRDRAPDESRLELGEAREIVGVPSSFRGGRLHTGQSALVGPGSAESRWEFQSDGRVSGQAVIGPDGRIVFGAHDGFLYVLTSSGELLWNHDLGGPIFATPLVDDSGRIFVGCDADIYWSFSRDGEVLWQLETAGDADTGTVQGEDGTLYFAAGRELWAIQPNGETRWKFQAREKIYSTPAIDIDGTIYFGSQDDHFYALAPDGRMRWSYRTRGDNDGSAVISPDGTIYFGSDDHHVYGLDRDGQLRWSRDLEGFVRAPLALGRDGAVLAATFGPTPRLVALDPRNGEQRWFFPVTVADSAQLGIMSGPTVDAEGNIFFGAHDDYLYGLSGNGDLRFAFRTGGDVDGTPIVLDDLSLVFGSGDGRLYRVGESSPGAEESRPGDDGGENLPRDAGSADAADSALPTE